MWLLEMQAVAVLKVNNCVGFHYPGGTEMFEKMNGIREKQEELAQLHFEQDLKQDMRRFGLYQSCIL